MVSATTLRFADDQLARVIDVDRQAAANLLQFSPQRIDEPVLVRLAKDGLHDPRRLELAEEGVQRLPPLGIGLGLLGQVGGHLLLGAVLPRLDLVGDEVAADTADHTGQRHERTEVALVCGSHDRQQGCRRQGAVGHAGSQPADTLRQVLQPAVDRCTPGVHVHGGLTFDAVEVTAGCLGLDADARPATV